MWHVPYLVARDAASEMVNLFKTLASSGIIIKLKLDRDDLYHFGKYFENLRKPMPSFPSNVLHRSVLLQTINIFMT